MRIAMVLAGMHRVLRGAEVAFESIAERLGDYPDVELTVFGSGEPRPGKPYEFVSAPSRDRTRFEGWPRLPMLRNEWQWEEATFIRSVRRHYDPAAYDLTVACSFPYSNLFLTRWGRRPRPRHVFVTQNSDHPAVHDNNETRFFRCDGLVCTNPDYYDRNVARWNTVLIPNGVDPDRFSPGDGDRAHFDLPPDAPIALMVSAMIGEKRVAEGVVAAASVPGLHLVVCGDGPERRRIRELADTEMPGRFHTRRVPRADMPRMYRSADVFLHMSKNEPSANAYIEALSSGLPIVTHRRRVTEWTLGDLGYLVDTDDQHAVAGAITAALADDQGAAATARHARARERFSWDHLVEQYHRFFEAVLAGTPTVGIGATP